MNLEYPEALWFLFALPVLAFAAYVVHRRNLDSIRKLVGHHSRDAFVEALTFKRFVTGFFFMLAIGLGIVALADPHWGEDSVEDERRGLEIVFLMDVSNSMRAQDIAPSRLLRSREVARAVYNQVPQLAAAVIAFKGDETVVSPMTEDGVAFELAMDFLSAPLVSTPGTNIEAALTAAIQSFPGGSERRKVVILFSDGQELSGEFRRITRDLRLNQVTVVTVVTGTSSGALIPLDSGGVLRDSDGNPVVAGVDQAGLASLAEETGGERFSLEDAALVNSLKSYLIELSASGKSVVFRVRETPRYRVFAVLAVLLLAAGVLAEAHRWGGLV